MKLLALLAGGLHLAWSYSGEPNVEFEIWRSTGHNYWTLAGTTTNLTFQVAPSANKHVHVFYKARTRSLVTGLESVDSNVVQTQ